MKEFYSFGNLENNDVYIQIGGRGCGKTFFIREQLKRRRKRKFVCFLKRHRTTIKAILLTAGLFISYFVLNRMGNAWRGYKAVGGEILIFLVPFLIVSLRDCIADMIEGFKNGHK